MAIYRRARFLMVLVGYLRIWSATSWTAPRFRTSRYQGDGLSAAKRDKEHDASPHKARLMLDSGKSTMIRSRMVRLTNSWNVTIWEWDQPAAIVEHYWSVQQNFLSRNEQLLDPFGLIAWPGAVVAARELLKRQKFIENTTVLVLGAGTGVEAQAVAQLGAKRVLATDIHPTTLQLLRYGAERSGLQHVIREDILDLFSNQPLPCCDILLAADVLYNPILAKQVGKKCEEFLKVNPKASILVTDSQRFHGTDFVPDLNKMLAEADRELAAWQEHALQDYTGSGVLVDEDQTYDVTARVLSIGW